ncbi:hypothetical protein [Brumimicrobium mesophilum]|uniref:hypothetical protein n=1 Tax=Brumimicrobium mesophilum TaxID=392717 RepID=UPI000D143C67|nr:hypothetical protein [Brumimicrobium mesophilum]
MKLLNRTLLHLCCVGILLFSSCEKLEFDKIAQGAWNPNFAVPIAHSNFSAADILAHTDSTDLVVVDANTGAIALVYKSDIFSIGANSILQLQDMSETAVLDFSQLNVPASPTFIGSVTSNNNEDITFNAGTAELHQVDFKSGMISINISANISHDITCKITFPALNFNGSPISETISLTYSGSVPHSGTATFDLTNVLGDFTLGSAPFNEISVNMETTITGTGEPITGNEDITIDFSITNLDFNNAIGYFGQNDLGIPGDSVLLKIFENSNNGYFEIVNPKINFYAENSFGFPIRVNFADLKTVDVENGNEYPLTGFPSFFDITRPASMGQSSISMLELNTSNTGNLSNIISSVPKYFVYQGSVLSNPNGSTTPLNFITDQSQLNIRTEVEMPLEGSAYGFEFKDTLEFEFEEDLTQLESVMFRLNVDNGFPVDLKSQITFLDENYAPLFTAFNTPESVVLSASVDNTGKVNERAQKITDINLNEQEIQQMQNVKYILFNAVSQTYNGLSGQLVKFYDHYNLDFRLGIQVQGKIEL